MSDKMSGAEAATATEFDEAIDAVETIIWRYDNAEEITRGMLNDAKHGVTSLRSAVAALIAERDALRDLHTAVTLYGNWDDGCFYYARHAAPELERALRNIDAARAEAGHG